MRGSSNHKLGIDVGSFSIKSIAGQWKKTSGFSGKVGSYIIHSDGGHQGANIGDDIHHSIQSIYQSKYELYTTVHLTDVIVREVEVEFNLSEFELENAIEAQLVDSLPFDIDEIYFDYMPAAVPHGEHISEKQKYLVVASQKDEIDKIVDNIKTFNKKIRDVNVDIDAYAYGRLMSVLYEDILQDDLILLIDIGHEHSRFYFFDNDNLVFNRVQQIGGKYVTESIAEIYDVSFEEAQTLKHQQEHDSEFNDLVVKSFSNSFFEQLQLVRDFFEASAVADKKVAKVILSGGGSCLSGFVDALRKEIELPIEVLDLSAYWHGSIPDGWSDREFSAKFALSLSMLIEGQSK